MCIVFDLYVYVYMYMSVYVCMYLYLCVYVYVCTCVCVYVCVCVCGTPRFLDYGEPSWRKEADECLAAMNTFSEDVRNNFISTLDWLHEHAFSRTYGLGECAAATAAAAVAAAVVAAVAAAAVAIAAAAAPCCV